MYRGAASLPGHKRIAAVLSRIMRQSCAIAPAVTAGGVEPHIDSQPPPCWLCSPTPNIRPCRVDIPQSKLEARHTDAPARRALPWRAFRHAISPGCTLPASIAAMQLALGPIDGQRRRVRIGSVNFMLGYLTQGSLWAQRCRANRSMAFVEPNLTRSVKWAQAALRTDV